MQKWDRKGKYLLVHSNDTFQSLWMNPSIGRLMFKRNINHTITVDACHTCYNHLLILVAVMQDGNGKLQFIAAGLCSSENKENFISFLQRLKFIVVKKRRITIVSDRSLAIEAAVRDVFGEQAQHVCCWKHLERNIKQQWTPNMNGQDVAKLLFYISRMAKTATTKEFTHYQELLKTEYNAIYKKLNGVSHIWARIQLQDHIYGVITSNAAEIVNGLLLRPINFGECARDSHVVVMTVCIYNLIRSQIEKRREAVDDFLSRNGQLERVSDYVMKKINAYNNSSLIDQLVVINEVVYHKERLSDRIYDVDLTNKTCSCRMYQECGYPCIHAYVLLCNKQPFLNTMINLVSKHYWMSTVDKTCVARLPNPPDVSVEAICQFSMDFDEENCDCIKNTSIRYTHGVSDVESIRTRVNALHNAEQEKKKESEEMKKKKKSEEMKKKRNGNKKGTGGTLKKAKTSTRLSTDNWGTCDAVFFFEENEANSVSSRMQTWGSAKEKTEEKKTEKTNSLLQNSEDKSSEDKVLDPEGEAVDSEGEDQGVEKEDLGYGLDDLRSEIEALRSEIENLSSDGDNSDFGPDFGIEDVAAEDEELSSEEDDSDFHPAFEDEDVGNEEEYVGFEEEYVGNEEEYVGFEEYVGNEEGYVGNEEEDVGFEEEYVGNEEEGVGFEEEYVGNEEEDSDYEEEYPADEEEKPVDDLLDKGRLSRRHMSFLEKSRKRKQPRSQYSKTRPDLN